MDQHPASEAVMGKCGVLSLEQHVLNSKVSEFLIDWKMFLMPHRSAN